MQSPSNPPPILRPRFFNFPAELTSRAQWVLWKAVWLPDKGKYNKVPYNARTLQKGDVTDPEVWSDFATVKAAYEKNPAPAEDPQKGFAGVGFALSDGDPFCGVDLDHVIDANRALSEEAAQIISDLATYAEVSPSGTGIRLFALATLPPGGRKRGDIECYESGRFLTFTGRRLEQSTLNIEARQAEVETFHAKFFPAQEKPKRKAGASTTGFDADDTKLLEKATTAKNNGTKITALYAGSTAGYPGQSEADFALCSFLAFWTGDDPARLDRLFRGSQLMRDKWNERRYADGSTYGEKTIERAIASCTEFYQPSTRKPLDAEEVKRSADSVGAKRAGKQGGANRPPTFQAQAVAVDAIPVPALRTDRGAKEYAPYQIAELLGLKVQAPDSQRALAERAVRHFAEDLRYCRQLGWLHFGGKRWESDDKPESNTSALFCSLSSAIREEAGQLFRYVADLIGADRREDADAMMRAAKRHLTHVKAVETEQFVRGAMNLARPALDAPLALFTPRPWMIGFDNAVWDQGTLREHRREDYLTDLAPVSVDEGADQREWLALLDRITGGDADLARTLQETAGYALCGASTLRYLPWLYGPRGSGKSTIAELLITCLGSELSTMVDPKSLSDDAPRDRLGAALWKKRLAVCSEAGLQRIEAEVLKTLSGGDTMPVRFHYHEQFTARPTHLLMCVANDPPNMNAYDDALRDRVAAIPCEHLLAGGEPLVFSDGVRVEEVRSKVHSALVRGFIVWALEGMGAVYQSQVVWCAPIVQRATEQFWRDTDPLTEFWQTQEEAELRKGVGRSELRQRYQTWAAEQCIRKPLTPKVWGDACRAYGLSEGWEDTRRVWRLTVKKANPTNVTNTTNAFSNKLTRGEEKDIGEFTGNSPGNVGNVGGSKAESEALAAFISAECENRPDAAVDFAVLLRAYETWARANRVRPLAFSFPRFENRLNEINGISVRKNNVYTGETHATVTGLALRTVSQAEPFPPVDEPPFDDSGLEDPFADYPNEEVEKGGEG